MNYKQHTAVFISVVIAITSMVVEHFLWYLGDIYWYLLFALLISAIVFSGIAFVSNPGNRLIQVGIVVLLAAGQWWAIKMALMLTIWKIVGFAP